MANARDREAMIDRESGPRAYTRPMPRPAVMLYLAGAPSAAVRARFGTYVDWFGRLIAAHEVDMQVFDGLGGQMPALDDVDGVVITGSAASLTEPEPWMDTALALVRAAHEARTPLLGVCFGHQLIGAALGGRVVRNPRGWQLATRDVSLTEAGRGDALFAGLPERFPVNLSHQDIVCETSLPEAPRVEVLAGNAKASIQAVAVGPYTRGVQFHPEFSGEVTAAYIEARRALLTEDAVSRDAPEDLPETLLAEVRDSPEGEQVLHNFIAHFVPPRDAGA